MRNRDIWRGGEAVTRYFVVLALSAALCGCGPETRNTFGSANGESIASQLKYMKDSKGLCYAYFNSGTNGGVSFTNIPCLKDMQ